MKYVQIHSGVVHGVFHYSPLPDFHPSIVMIHVPDDFHPEIGVGEDVFIEQLSAFLQENSTESKE